MRERRVTSTRTVIGECYRSARTRQARQLTAYPQHFPTTWRRGERTGGLAFRDECVLAGRQKIKPTVRRYVFARR